MIGQNLAHYEIQEKIGSGGMGDVYLAEDTKLDRKVALKVLPPELAENEERRARFQREAKAIAALDHPNIVQVFSVEEAEGTHFITMQLVQGKTLTELLPKNGFSLSKFFEIAIPLADAVAAAHQEGITHRDLKPDNVMESEDGRVKVLDFGLAKLRGGLAVSSDAPTAAKTDEGVIVGTVAYMSPEQAEGKPVDTRSDIFSLGIMLYEMLTGERPFRGDTAASVLSSIIKDEPDSLLDRKPEIPRELAKIVRRCLAKDPTRRFQSALDLRNELEELRVELSSGELAATVAPAVPASWRPWGVSASLVAILALIAVILYIVFGRSGDESLRLTNPTPVTSAAGVENYPTWSPEGGRLAYESDRSGNWDIWVTQLGGGQPVNRTRGHAGSGRYPSWSPDGRQIAFLSQREGEWSLYIMPAVGGSARKVSNLGMASGDTTDSTGAPQWSVEGDEVAVAVRAAGQNAIEIIELRTQEVRRVPLPAHEGNECLQLAWSPDGSYFAYVEANSHTAEITRLWVIPFGEEEATPITEGRTNDWSPIWLSERELLFVSNRGGARDLWQQRIGSDGTPRGDPEPVSVGLDIRSVALSPDGSKLAYSRGGSVSNVWRVPILHDRPATWADAEQLTFDQAFVEFGDVSPDGERLVVSSDRSGNQDLWILPSSGGDMTQLTTEPTPDWAPRWSPDGEEIAFYSYRSGNRDIWVMPSEGGAGRQLTSHPSEDTVPTWSPDGQTLAFSSRRKGNRDIWIVDTEGSEPRQITDDPAWEWAPVYSPDGERLVFGSTASGEVRLRRVAAAGGESQPLSKGPGQVARFSSRSRIIYFTTWNTRRGGELWALSLEDGREYPVTDFEGRPGSAGHSLATDGEYLYFTWWEELGDLWVTDVVTE